MHPLETTMSCRTFSHKYCGGNPFYQTRRRNGEPGPSERDKPPPSRQKVHSSRYRSRLSGLYLVTEYAPPVSFDRLFSCLFFVARYLSMLSLKNQATFSSFLMCQDFSLTLVKRIGVNFLFVKGLTLLIFPELI